MKSSQGHSEREGRGCDLGTQRKQEEVINLAKPYSCDWLMCETQPNGQLQQQNSKVKSSKIRVKLNRPLD